MRITRLVKWLFSRSGEPPFSKVALEPRGDRGSTTPMLANPLMLQGLFQD